MTSPTGSNSSFPRRAFTLIEVLVTVVILFAGVAVILGCFRVAVNALDAATRTVRVNLFLREKMTEAELLLAGDRLPDRDGGRCASPLTACSWERRSRIVIPARPCQLREVAVEVAGQEASDHYVLFSEFTVLSKP